MRPRHIALGIALACTLAASVWLAAEDDALTAPPRSPRPDAARSAGGKDGSGLRPAGSAAAAPALAPGPEDLARPAFATATANLFAAHDWRPPPPPPPKPPPPQAPPLPFRYLGQLVEGEQTVVFLAAGNRTVLARAGDRLEGQYRVEAVDADRIVFLYEPLAERQHLPIGRTP